MGGGRESRFRSQHGLGRDYVVPFRAIIWAKPAAREK